MENLSNIIKNCIRGDEKAQRDMYLGHRVQWYMQCLRYGEDKFEADDILQEGLIQIYKDLHQFDERKASFATWSSRVLSHAALKFLKRHRWNKAFTDIDSIDETADQEELVYDKLAAKELIQLLQQLPLGYRVVFNMYVIEGYKHHEISKGLGITIGTSKSQLSKAKKMLREKIEFHLTEYSRK